MTVYIIDDDSSVREGLDSLFRSVGYQVRAFGSAKSFLEAERDTGPGCVVLDVRMPGLSGLDLQEELAKRDDKIPIVFLTGHGDIPMSVRAIKKGAVEFLLKPFHEQSLLDAIGAAIAQDKIRQRSDAELEELKSRFATLSLREQEVIKLVAAGRLNKQIAAQFDIAEITVKVHRAQAMRKMRAETLAALVRMADKLGL